MYKYMFAHLNAFYLFLRSIWICFFQLVWKLNHIYLHLLICITSLKKRKEKRHIFNSSYSTNGVSVFFF